MAPNFEDKLIVIISQGVIVIEAFNTVNQTIDNIIKLQYFSNCKLNPCREIVRK
jgi:hypothetical protein